MYELAYSMPAPNPSAGLGNVNTMNTSFSTRDRVMMVDTEVTESRLTIDRHISPGFIVNLV